MSSTPSSSRASARPTMRTRSRRMLLIPQSARVECVRDMSARLSSPRCVRVRETMQDYRG
eukprot:3299525-Prymnesium_polylepis.1